MNKPKKPFYKRWWFIVIAIIVVVAALTGGDDTSKTADSGTATESADSEKPAENKEPEAKEPEKTEYKAGMYKVGEELPAGEYVLIASGAGYLEVAADSTGNLESIVGNDNFAKTSIITVQDGEYFKLQGAKAIPIAEVTDELTPKDGVYKDGMFRVGIDIPAGEYKVDPGAAALGYIEITPDSRHSMMNIISNANLTTEIYQTLTEGTYVKLQNGASIKVEQ
ncbi:hypothetical protein EUAN_07230 [Andreesenia angusta]|uniref:Uncharacterized protein n=1 Tax=Andreesenia angusta TaxID=39480 RepID=A0A1S1VAT2_9FIRM|nr:hypothetical protein [Andreesenia angusta]OHW62939.1 hypothetical protein EUAN_07230 [Andreesenia angusta]